jgi:cytidyltransferase-like protein
MSRSVLIGGVFDPLHAGHLAYIREAQAFGFHVDCALSDAPEKHPPLVPIRQRAALLKALGVRDVYEHKRAADLPDMILALKPNCYIKGVEWEGQLPEEQVRACYDAGAVIVFVNTKQQSSSKMLADYERKRNTEKLSAFEQFVSEQKPAEKPWEPVTDYSRETRRAIEAPQADIIADVFKGLSVLDYGCGFGYLMELLQERGMDVDGFDKAHGAKHPTKHLLYDVVICREVLEHTTARQLRWIVTSLTAYAAKYVYVTTRFTAKPHLLDFDDHDSLDPTHISMLNQDLLRTLFVLEGCTRRMDLEEKLDHRKLGRCLVYEVPA